MTFIFPLVGLGSLAFCVIALIAAIFPGNRMRRLKCSGGAFVIFVATLILSIRYDQSADTTRPVSPTTSEASQSSGTQDRTPRPRARPKPKPVPTIRASDAARACEQIARASASHPSTVKRTWDLVFDEASDGTARLQMGFKARNSFNLELTFNIVCLFEGYRLVDYSISER